MTYRVMYKTYKLKKILPEKSILNLGVLILVTAVNPNSRSDGKLRRFKARSLLNVRFLNRNNPKDDTSFQFSTSLVCIHEGKTQTVQEV